MNDKDNPREGPSRETLAYIAGIIDGEGTIFISRGKPTGDRTSPSYVACLRVGNTDRRLIDFLYQAFQFGGVNERRTIDSRWKTCWMWAVTGPNAGKATRAVRPFLLLKGAQADLLLEFLDNFRSFELNGRHGVGTEELDRREMLRQRIRALNRKGPPATTERENTSDGEATV